MGASPSITADMEDVDKRVADACAAPADASDMDAERSIEEVKRLRELIRQIKTTRDDALSSMGGSSPAKTASPVRFRDADATVLKPFKEQRFNEPGELTWVAFCQKKKSPLVIVAGESGMIRSYDVNKGLLVTTFDGQDGHKNAVTGMSFAKKEVDYFCSGSQDKTVKLWKIGCEDCIATIRGHSQGVTCVALFDTLDVVSGSRDGNLRLWRFVSSEKCFVPDKSLGGGGKSRSSSAGILSIDVTPRLVACGRNDASMQVYDLEDGSLICDLAHNGWIYSCVFSREDQRSLVAGCSDGVARIYDLVKMCKEHAARNETKRNQLVRSKSKKINSPNDTSSRRPGSSRGLARRNSINASRRGSLGSSGLTLLDSSSNPSAIDDALTARPVTPTSSLTGVLSGGETTPTHSWQNNQKQKCLKMTHGHANWVLRCQLTDLLCVTASKNGDVNVWETPTGEAFLPDPADLVVVEHKEQQPWRSKILRVTRDFVSPDDDDDDAPVPTAVALNWNSTLVAASYTDGRLRVFRLNDPPPPSAAAAAAAVAAACRDEDHQKPKNGDVDEDQQRSGVMTRDPSEVSLSSSSPLPMKTFAPEFFQKSPPAAPSSSKRPALARRNSHTSSTTLT